MILLLLACAPESHDRFDKSGEIAVLEVEIEVGNVRIVGMEREDVHIERQLSGALSEPPLLENGILNIETACPTLLPCSADLEIEVPNWLPVSVRVREGDVRLVGLTGNIRIEVDHGDIDGTELNMSRLEGRIGMGDALLHLEGPPEVLKLGTGLGDVRLQLPEGGYEFDLQSLLPPEVIGLKSDPQGPHIQVQSASGRVVVRAANTIPEQIIADRR